MFQEDNATTYQDAYQWPSTMPKSDKTPNLMAMARPKTAPQKKNLQGPIDACKVLTKAFENGCKKSDGGKKKSTQGSTCLHVNVFMPYQVNFNNIPAEKKKGKGGLNAYIYGSERKEALQV